MMTFMVVLHCSQFLSEHEKEPLWICQLLNVTLKVCRFFEFEKTVWVKPFNFNNLNGLKYSLINLKMKI